MSVINEPQLVLHPLSYDATTVAKVLGLSERKVWQMVKAKEIPHKRYGGRVVFPAQAIVEWLNTDVEGIANGDDQHRPEE